MYRSRQKSKASPRQEERIPGRMMGSFCGQAGSQSPHSMASRWHRVEDHFDSVGAFRFVLLQSIELAKAIHEIFKGRTRAARIVVRFVNTSPTWSRQD